MRTRARVPIGVCLGLVLCSVASPAHAQSIEGVVRHGVSGAPLPGVLVSVLDVEGARVRSVLTDADGGFVVEVPLGRYGLRAERIGLGATTVDPFDVATFNPVFQRLEMVEQAIAIEGLVVDSRVRSCRTDARQANTIQRWWTEIRTALDVSAALQREEFGQFVIVEYDREWDEDLELLGSSRRWRTSRSTRPFYSAPADELVREGFVRGPFGPNRFYYGPDADVLLSTVFLSSHCFSLERSRDRRDQLGLRFEPTESRGVTDIEGTLWVDTTSAELTDLEFRYVDLVGPEGDEAGGSAVFDYLPSGAWIISEWFIRIPKTGRRGNRRRLTTLGYSDGGGEVIPLPEPVAGAPVGGLRGVVVDSLRGGALAGATVLVLGTDHQARSDAEGRFQIDGVPIGDHLLAFDHPDLRLWGFSSELFRSVVVEGETAEVTLAVGSLSTLARAACLGLGAGAETILLGRVVGSDGAAVPGAGLQAIYERRAGAGGSEVTLNTRADEEGRFAICSVPGETSVTMRGRVGRAWIEAGEVTIPTGRVTYREVRLGGGR